MTRARVNPEIRAAAIADLLTGDQPAVVADRYGLNAATVRTWKLRLEQDGEGVAANADATPVATVHVPPVATQRAARFRQPSLEAQHLTLAELVEANLRAKLIATQRIAVTAEIYYLQPILGARIEKKAFQIHSRQPVARGTLGTKTALVVKIREGIQGFFALTTSHHSHYKKKR